LATYIIHQLVEDPANEGLLLSADWYIMPVMNPDGIATISFIPFSV
jgi:murein tripeptide amidase MpaA